MHTTFTSQNFVSPLPVRGFFLTICLLLLPLLGWSVGSSTVVISQVYGGGSNSGASYNADFVELYNLGSTTIDLTGYSVQYASATGVFSTSTNAVALTGNIAPGKYFLIQMQTAGTTGNNLPTPDAMASSNINMAVSSGKVQLIRTTTAPATTLIDLVAYGTGATPFEGTGPATAANDNAKSVIRKNNGATDSDDNKTDFTTDTAIPRNSTSSLVPPSVTSNSATNLRYTSVTLSGSVIADGGTAVTKRGFVYSTTTNPRIGVGSAVQVASGAGTGDFSSDISGLTSSTTYYFAAYAENSTGIAYTTTKQFTTPGVPSFTVTPTVLPESGKIFTATDTRASAYHWYSFNGNNLQSIDNVTITASSGYEITTDTINTVPQSTISEPGVNLNTAKRIFVRLKAGAVANPVNGTVTNSYPGLSNQVVTLTGKRIASPTLTATPTTLTFSVTAPAAAVEQSYHLVGANLTQSVTTTSAVGYEISATSGGPYTTKLSLTASASGDLDRYVYVRLKGNQGAGTVNGTIENFSGALGAPVTVKGTITPNPALVAEPKTQGSFTFVAVSGSTIQVNLVPGSGARRLLVVREASAVNGDPQDGVAYAASTRFGAGDVTQPGNYVVYSGNSSSITVTNLTAGTVYYFALYEYNGSGNNVNFLIPGFTGNTSTTTVLPTGGPGELVMEESFNYGPSAKLTDNGWIVVSGSTNSIVTSAASLSYAEYGSLPSGSYAASVSNSGEDALKLFGRSFTTGDLYTSLLVQVNNVGVNNEYFFALSPASLYTSYTGRIHLKNGAVPNTFNVGISFNGTAVNNAQIVYATNANGEVVNYTAGSSYLLVVKYTKKPGSLDDVIKLFVFDAGVPNTEPTNSANTATVTADFTGSGGTVFTTEQNPAGIALRQYNANQSITVDGLRVGTGWGSTVGRPVFVDDTYNLLAGNYYDVTLTGVAANIQAVGKSYIQSQLNLLNGRLLTSTANLVTVGSSAQNNKGNANSFVEGPLARVFPLDGATLTFGIGRDGIYRPFTLGLTNTVSATVLSAEMVNETTPNGTTFATDSELNRTSRVRYFRVTRLSGPDARAAQATLSYGNDDDVVEPATLRVAKSANNGANAYANVGPVTGGTATPAGSITSDLFTESFATPVIFALANKIGGFNPLPVELTAFTAERQGTDVQVKWTTATERNSASFLIERSADGLTFQTIGSIAAQGTATTSTGYQFTDSKALIGLAYYRLRQLDQDGSAHLSVVRTVQGRQLMAGIYPNPVQNLLHVEMPATKGVVQAIITDLAGREVYHTIVPASHEIDLQQLPQGSYLLMLQGQQLHSTHKLVKTN